jgi:hypothetical protein
MLGADTNFHMPLGFFNWGKLLNGRPGLAGLALLLLAGLADCVSSPDLQAEAASISTAQSAAVQLKLDVDSDTGGVVLASTEAAPVSAGPNPAMLRQCQQACKSGGEAVGHAGHMSLPCCRHA